LSALRRRPARIHNLRLDHFLAEDLSSRRRTVELEFASLLGHLRGIRLHLIDHLLLRLTATEQHSDDRSADRKRTLHNLPFRSFIGCATPQVYGGVRYTDRGILFSVGRRTAPAQWDVVLMR
jgi:hypothetical protein